jgi:hypothetical protein
VLPRLLVSKLRKHGMPLTAEAGETGSRHESVLNTYSPHPTSVLTAAVISATAFFASAKYMLVLGLAYSSLSMPA